MKKLSHFDARTGLSVDCLSATKPPLYEPCAECAFVAVTSSQAALDVAAWEHHIAAHSITACLPTVAFSGRVSGNAP